MATGWNVMDALNKRTKATVEDNTPRARFRTKDISIKRMYTNDRNFYSMQDIKSLAQEIYAVGLLENMTVVYDPCERGEYRIIAGERRWRALTLLVSQGHTEFEVASCKIKTPAGTHEEMVQLIIANAYRDKTATDILEEERQLKESLQYMKDNGLTLQGYDLNSGRLRNVIADMMKMSTGKIAQIESINKHLIPEFSEELKAGRLTFSAAYEISGMPEDVQREMLSRYKESGAVMLWKEVKAEKKKQQEEPEEQQAEEDDDQTAPYTEEDGGRETEKIDDADADTDDEDIEEPEPWEEAHTVNAESLCYGCSRYNECTSRSWDVLKCDRYIDKAEAEKTPEQKYDEEQAAIDRETKKKLREQEQKEQIESIRQKDTEMEVRVSMDLLNALDTGKQPYLITKENGKFKAGHTVLVKAYQNGFDTGVHKKYEISCMDTADTSTAIDDGWCIIGLKKTEGEENEND